MTNASIQQWLTQLVPLAQIVGIVNQVLPWFQALGIFFVAAGVFILVLNAETAMRPYARAAIVMACMLASGWFLTLGEQAVGALVNAIGQADPALNWLIVSNPGNADLTMNFTKPFSIIGQYVGGTFAQTNGAQWFEIGKWIDYVVRVVIIGICGFAAAITVFIMEALLILQKLILVMSVPLLPVLIGCLMSPTTHGMAVTFIKNIAGVLAWPIGWAIAHIGTMAFLQNLQAPSWTASFGQLFISTVWLCVICGYMVLATVAAPVLIFTMVVSGSNFAHHLFGGFAATAGQHAANAAQSVGGVAGALAASPMGPGAAAMGATIGSAAGSIAGMPITSVAEATGQNRAIPSSRSRGAADAAVKGIVARSW